MKSLNIRLVLFGNSLQRSGMIIPRVQRVMELFKSAVNNCYMKPLSYLPKISWTLELCRKYAAPWFLYSEYFEQIPFPRHWALTMLFIVFVVHSLYCSQDVGHGKSWASRRTSTSAVKPKCECQILKFNQLSSSPRFSGVWCEICRLNKSMYLSFLLRQIVSLFWSWKNVSSVLLDQIATRLIHLVNHVFTGSLKFHTCVIPVDIQVVWGLLLTCLENFLLPV